MPRKQVVLGPVSLGVGLPGSLERLSDLAFQRLVDLAGLGEPFGDAPRGIGDQTDAVAPLVLEVRDQLREPSSPTL